MKVTKAQANENREAILRAASQQIRMRGFDQVSVAEVGRAAGLSHGALYSHFKSKEALQAEATRHSFDATIRAFCGLEPQAFIETYLSVGHRDHPEVGCPNAALVSDVWRQPTSTQEAFRSGIERFISLVADKLPDGDRAGKTDRAVMLLAAMVGGMALSRAVSQVDQTYADEILRAVSSQVAGLTGRAE